MGKITIIEGNSNDKDNIRLYMTKGEKGDKGDKGQDGTGTKLSDLENDMGFMTETDATTLMNTLIEDRVLSMYPIGSLYFTVNNVNPSTFIGGYWQQVATGQFLVGAGTGTDQNNVEKTFIVGENAGTYEHTHEAGTYYAMSNPTSGGQNYKNMGLSFSTDYEITGAGGSKQMASNDNTNAGIQVDGISGSSNNVAPSFGLYAWQRINPPVEE